MGKQASAVAGVPRIGAYLTDGARLAEMIGVDDDGNLHLEDCSVDFGVDTSRASILLTPNDLVNNWEVVRGAG